MSRNGIYLGGKMEKIEWSEMTGWRDEMKVVLDALEIPYLCPTRRGILHERFDDENVRGRIVQQDLQDLCRCSVMIANMQGPGAGLGTMAEMSIAQRDRIPIILILDEGAFKHPFLFYFATEVYYNCDDALEAAISYFG